MRRMSFSMTKQQYLDGTKTVTRRLGWWLDRKGQRRLIEGDEFMGVEKAQGLKKGERQVQLGASVALNVRREPLNAITQKDVVREGFPEMTREEFIAMFCKANGCKPDTEVTRIAFRRMPACPACGDRGVNAYGVRCWHCREDEMGGAR